MRAAESPRETGSKSGARPPLPREHGAWAMLIMPWVVGVGVAGRVVPEALLFLLAAVCCFGARYPLGILAKERSAKGGRAGRTRSEPLFWLAGYGALAGLCGAALLFGYGRWGLLPLGLAALPLLALQPALRRHRLDRTVVGELLAFAGLALTGPGAYYVSTGRPDATAGLVWLLTFLYAGASVFYVKLRVKQRMLRAAAFGLGQRWLLGRDMALYQAILLATVALLAITRQVPWLAPAAFAPLSYKVVRDIWRVAPELNLRRLGLVEIGHSVAFVVLLIAAYAVG